MFNSSFRKIIDTLKYEDYNEFVIFLDLLEKELTDLLLGNKKLLINIKMKNLVIK